MMECLQWANEWFANMLSAVLNMYVLCCQLSKLRATGSDMPSYRELHSTWTKLVRTGSLLISNQIIQIFQIHAYTHIYMNVLHAQYCGQVNKTTVVSFHSAIFCMCIFNPTPLNLRCSTRWCKYHILVHAYTHNIHVHRIVQMLNIVGK